MQTTIAILAGGKSRRMGRDKAEIIIEGERLLARTARVARETCLRVCVAGRAKPSDWLWEDVTFWPDETAGSGPLAGLTAALRRLPFCESSALLLIACDMPLLTAEALEWLRRMGEARWPLGDGLVTVNAGQREPLFSLYTPECLALASRQLTSGRRSLIALIEAGRFQFVETPPEIRAALCDADTPEELAALTQAKDGVQ